MSALPRMYWPEDEGLSVEELAKAVKDGRACVECHGEWKEGHAKPPVICKVCANTYLTQLLDTLGYTLRSDRGMNAEAHAQLARERRERTENNG